MGVILTKLEDTAVALRKYIFDLFRGAITQADPNNFGWKSKSETPLMIVGVFRDDNEIVIAGIFPRCCVVRVPQAQRPHVR